MVTLYPSETVVKGTILTVTADFFMIHTATNKTVAVPYQPGFKVGDTVYVTKQGNSFYIVSKIAGAVRTSPKQIYLMM